MSTYDSIAVHTRLFDELFKWRKLLRRLLGCDRGIGDMAGRHAPGQLKDRCDTKEVVCLGKVRSPRSD